MLITPDPVTCAPVRTVMELPVSSGYLTFPSPRALDDEQGNSPSAASIKQPQNK